MRWVLVGAWAWACFGGAFMYHDHDFFAWGMNVAD